MQETNGFPINYTETTPNSDAELNDEMGGKKWSI